MCKSLIQFRVWIKVESLCFKKNWPKFQIVPWECPHSLPPHSPWKMLKSELHPAEEKKKGNVWDQRKRKRFGAREGRHFPSAQQKFLIEIAEIKNVRDLWGKPGPAIRERAAPQIWGDSRISNPFFVQTFLKENIHVEASGPALQEPGWHCHTSWGAAPTWASLLASRREITLPSFAHHSGSSGDLTPEAETQNILPADTEPPTCWFHLLL